MNIYESIAAIQADVDFIGKDKTVQSGGTYKYRGVDQVLNTLHPLFAKHKVFAVPEVLEVITREWRKTAKGGDVVYQILHVKYTFYAEDGSNVSAVVIGEAMDSADKSSNKCMSVAYKYACFQILSIPTEETTQDPDETNEALAHTPYITFETVVKYAGNKAGGVAKWLQDMRKKKLEEFTQEEAAWAIKKLEERAARENGKNELATELQNAEGDLPF